MNINEPIEVTPQHEPITPLQAALDALERGDGHISPLQAEKLLAHIKRLKRHRDTTDVINHNLAAVNEQQTETILDLSERLSRHAPANPYEPTEIWDNETGVAYDTQPNVIQQALDSLSPEMRASHFTTLRKKQDDNRWNVDDCAIAEWDEDDNVSVDDVLGRLRYWASGKQGEPESIRDIEFIVELVHEIEQLQTDLIEARKFANDAIETSMALAWNAWRVQ